MPLSASCGREGDSYEVASPDTGQTRGANVRFANRLVRGERIKGVCHGMARAMCAAMKHLSVGIGCKLNTSADQIETAVRAALGARAFDDIACVATLDIKARETGIIEFCSRHALPLEVFSRAEIETLSGLPTPSDAARKHLGIDGVCEPCALLAAPGGQLIVTKTVLQGVTVAIASNAANTKDTL